MADTGDTLNEIFDDLCRTTENKGKVTIGQITESLGHRGFGPCLTVPALVEMSPIGGIPAVPTLLALIIVLFAVQIALGRDHMWMPAVVRQRRIAGGTFRNAIEKVRPVADWLGRWVHERLPRLAGNAASRVAAVIVIFMCLSVPPLELVPFASTAPMGAIALIGLAMTVRDGALMLAAYTIASVAAGGALLTWLGG